MGKDDVQTEHLVGHEAADCEQKGDAEPKTGKETFRADQGSSPAGYLQLNRARAKASTSPVLLPTPCRGGRRRPPPLQYVPVDAAQLAFAEAPELPPTPQAKWVDPEARYLWASRAKFRFYATVAAVVVTVVVAVVGIILAIDQGRHSFQSIVPARPMSANIGDLIRLPRGAGLSRIREQQVYVNTKGADQINYMIPVFASVDVETGHPARAADTQDSQVSEAVWGEQLSDKKSELVSVGTEHEDGSISAYSATKKSWIPDWALPLARGGGDAEGPQLLPPAEGRGGGGPAPAAAALGPPLG